MTGETFTYGEVRTNVVKIASSLSRRGVVRGDVVAIYSQNSLKWAMFFYGALASGATVTTVNPAYTARKPHSSFIDSLHDFFHQSCG